MVYFNNMMDATNVSASVAVMYLDLCKALIQFHILNCYTNYLTIGLAENYVIGSA